MSVREAITEWTNILGALPNGIEIETAEEGASPGAGAEMVASIIVYPDMSAAAFVLKAGMYDGDPRVFAAVFKGPRDVVSNAVNDWKRIIDK